LNVCLSNYEFRAYRKAWGAIWLHLRTRVLFETPVSFSIHKYLRNITGILALPDGSVFDIDGVTITQAAAVRYDGRVQVHEIAIIVPTGLPDVTPCIAELTLDFTFDFHGSTDHAHHEHAVLIRRMYPLLRGRRATV
jgi:hypothetical protein